MHNHLKFCKVCAQWVPRELKDQENTNQIGLSSQHLSRYEDEEDMSMLNRTVTGNKSWVLHYQAESKHATCSTIHTVHSTDGLEQQNDPLILPLLLTYLENNQNSIPNRQQALLDKTLNSFLKSCYAVKQPKHISFTMSEEILKKATLH